MRKLLQGIVEFRKCLTDEYRKLFAQLALGQKPDALFIACSDSRVVPDLFASTNPGDLFVLRNVGNLIPPYSSAKMHASAPAALEFSIFSLKISNIVVCGHSECGAIEAIMTRVSHLSCPHLYSWLKFGEDALVKSREEFNIDPALSEANQISQLNVLLQMEHLLTYPCVKEKLEKSELSIHGWWFDIAKADVYCYEPTLNKFVLIDEKESKLIFPRLH